MVSKANYAMKVGQKQSRCTETWKEQSKVMALREGIQGGNQITNWFQKKPPTDEHDSMIDASTAQSVAAQSSAMDEPSLPPSTQASTRAASPVVSQLSSENGSEHDIMQSSSVEERIAGNVTETVESVTGAVNCDDEQSNCPQAPEKGFFERPPSIDAAKLALAAIKLVLKPHRDTGAGYKDPQIDLLMWGHLDLMKLFLWQYIDSDDGWIASSLQVAHAAERGPWLAKQLRIWCRAYISDQECLPTNLYSRWNVSLLEDEDLAQEIHLHLQGIGKYVKAMDIVHFLDTPKMKARLNLKKMISLATAQRLMCIMDYRWTKNPRGQFVDGHEREDVVQYCQLVFLPFLANTEPSMRSWTKDIEDVQPVTGPGINTPHIIVWHHDESTFYANDQRKI
jgi:hypothetical protein